LHCYIILEVFLKSNILDLFLSKFSEREQ
jgi:hypothetical protein